MLKPQRAVLPFNKGIDRGGNDPRVTADLLVAQNCIFERNGAVSKRFGRSLITGSISDNHLGEHGGRPVVFGTGLRKLNGETPPAGTFDALTDGTGGAGMTNDPVGFVDISSQQIKATGDDGSIGMHRPEVLLYDEVEVATFFYGDYLWLETRNRRSRKVLDSSFVDSFAGGTTRLIQLSGVAEYIWQLHVATGNELYIRPVAADGTIGAGENVVTVCSWPLSDDAIPFDVCELATDKIGVVYKVEGADTLVFGWLQVDSTGAIVDNSYDIIEPTDLEYVTCCPYEDGEAFCAYYLEAAGAREVRGFLFDDTDTPVARLDTQIRTWATTDNLGSLAAITYNAETALVDGAIWVYWTEIDISIAAGAQHYDAQLRAARMTIDDASSAVDRERVLGGDCTLWCKPFMDSNGSVFLGLHLSHAGVYALSSEDDPQRLYVIVQDVGGASDLPIPVGKWLVGTADQVDIRALSRVWKTHVCTPQSLGSDTFVVAGIEVGQRSFKLAVRSQSILHAVLIDTDVAQVTSLNSLREMIMPNSCPQLFDGERVFEQGFLMAPPAPEVAISVTAGNFGGGGSYPDAGVYIYAALYELTDLNGNVWRSDLSVVSTIEVAAGEAVDVGVRTLKTTRLHTLDLKVVIYRSHAPGSAWLRRIKVCENDPTERLANAGAVWLDTGYDNTGAEQEYTRYGSVTGNFQPPPYRVATVWKGREFVIPRQFADRQCFYSKEFVEGEGHGFPPGHYFTFSPDGGEVTALAGLDDKLILFKERRVLFTHGNGYDTHGAGENFADPLLVVDGIGCSGGQRSVAVTPAGVFFQSEDCIHVLNRDLQVQPIGRRVKDITDACNITRAVVLARDSSVLFFTDHATETVLVYNYLVDAWTHWRNWAADDAVVVDGNLYSKPAGTAQVSYQDRTMCFDEVTTWVPLRVRIAPVSLAGLFSSKRLWEVFLLGYCGAQKLTVRMAYEGDPVWTDELEFVGDDLVGADGTFIGASSYSADTYSSAGNGEDRALLVRWRGSRTRVEDCVQIEIEDSQY